MNEVQLNTCDFLLASCFSSWEILNGHRLLSFNCSKDSWLHLTVNFRFHCGGVRLTLSTGCSGGRESFEGHIIPSPYLLMSSCKCCMLKLRLERKMKFDMNLFSANLYLKNCLFIC